MIFALAGNQNCGKTTFFNALTGSNQHVGNFPGVTVDRKSGFVKNEKNVEIVDLPGIYSIRPYTQEETVTRDYVLSDAIDGIINIVDATNIERNLYLTLQLIELNKPMVIALNMMDEVRKNGGSVDVKKLSEEIGVAVVPITANKGEGVSEVVHKAMEAVNKKILPAVMDFCAPGPVHRLIHSTALLIEDHAENKNYSPRFCATKLIEGDKQLEEQLKLSENELELLEHSIVEMETETGFDRNEALADMRYSFIESVVNASVVKSHESRERARSVKLDRLLTGKYTAVPVFVMLMVLIFYLTFGVIGQYLSDLMTEGINILSVKTDTALTAYGLNYTVKSLVIDGIFAGVGSVLSFLPIIVVLFFFLSILEDTGYMARVAFVMDKPLRKLGLSGKSFVPLLIGFGCTVPAIMATRTLSSDRDRKMTILLTPFMSCSAKIPVYGIFAAAFFPKYSALVMLLLYALGMAIGVICAVALKSTAFHGQPVPFVMELPNYRLPSFKNTMMLLWDKAKDFIVRAFTVIFTATVIIWFLQTFDTRLNVVTENKKSLLALIGRLIAPIFTPLGFGDWRAATALITGLMAKESVLSTLAVLGGTTVSALGNTLNALFTPVTAISFLVFTLLYTPCVAAIGTIKRELRSIGDTVTVISLQCVIAWAAAFIVYRILLFLM